MPLHDWTDRFGWDGLHLIWIVQLLHWVKPRLPAGYRAYVGTVPTVAVGAPDERPDVSVRQWPEQERPPAVADANGPPASDTESPEPDVEVALASLEPASTMFVERAGLLVAAVELISPRNKDRPMARATYLARYAGYLLQGVNLLLVDVHRRPLAFSFADGIARELGLKEPELPAPLAVSYRVGEPAATGGRLLAIWRRALEPGAPLPTLPLALNVQTAVQVDLETTYMRAAADAYLT
jgi:hypothetical protein